MAKSASKSGIMRRKAAAAPETDDLFAVAAATKKAEPKKNPGTVIALPKELDANGVLTEECQRLHDAVAMVIKAKEDEDKALNQGNLARGTLNPLVFGEFCRRIAVSGTLPDTPVQLVNHLGQALTYVTADKAGMYGLTPDQIEMLTEMLGADCVARITYEWKSYSFNPDVMQEIAGEVPVGLDKFEIAELPKVHQLVAKAVSGALKKLVESELITQEQMSGLLKADVKTKLKKGEIAHIAQYAGADVNRIQGALEALGTTFGRYLKP